MSTQFLRPAVVFLMLMLALTPAVFADGPFEGGGGPIVAGSLIDWAELQDRFDNQLAMTGDFQFDEEEIYLQYGGGGFGGSDFRLGGIGLSAEWTYPVSGESPFDRIMLTFDIHGLWLESFVSEFERGGLSLGTMIGMADLRLNLIQDFTGSFDEFIVEPPLKFAMSRKYWFVQPFISTEVHLIDFIALKLTAGYFQGISFGEWHLSGGQEVPDGPLKSLGFPSFQVMFLFGG